MRLVAVGFRCDYVLWRSNLTRRRILLRLVMEDRKSRQDAREVSFHVVTFSSFDVMDTDGAGGGLCDETRRWADRGTGNERAYTP